MKEIQVREGWNATEMQGKLDELQAAYPELEVLSVCCCGTHDVDRYTSENIYTFVVRYDTTASLTARQELEEE